MCKCQKGPSINDGRKIFAILVTHLPLVCNRRQSSLEDPIEDVSIWHILTPPSPALFLPFLALNFALMDHILISMYKCLVFCFENLFEQGKGTTVFEAEPVFNQNWAEEEFYLKYIYSFEAVLLLLVLFSLSILIVPEGFSDLTLWNNWNSNRKKKLVFRKLQEKLKKLSYSL